MQKETRKRRDRDLHPESLFFERVEQRERRIDAGNENSSLPITVASERAPVQGSGEGSAAVEGTDQRDQRHERQTRLNTDINSSLGHSIPVSPGRDRLAVSTVATWAGKERETTKFKQNKKWIQSLFGTQFKHSNQIPILSQSELSILDCPPHTLPILGLLFHGSAGRV